MSHYEILQFIRKGLNYIMDKTDIDSIVELYKLSILVRNSDDELYKKMFAVKYIDYYKGRIEFINGIEKMNDKAIDNIREIIISSLDLYLKEIRKKDQNYLNKYYERRSAFLNISAEEIRDVLIEELYSGLHNNKEHIKKIENMVDSMSYEERYSQNSINIDFELTKIKGKRKHKYTEDGNFEEDDEVLNTIINNLNKRGYSSNHLHIHAYDSLDNSINKIVGENNKVYKKI